MSVADDGRGIAKERRNTGFGMTSMQERADRIGASPHHRHGAALGNGSGAGLGAATVFDST